MVEPLCKVLEWDTNFFGIKIGRVISDKLDSRSMRKIDNWCRREHVRCLYFLARFDDALSTIIAEKSRFHLVDVRTTMQYQKKPFLSSRQTTKGFNGIIRCVRREDIPYLKNASKGMFGNTRFYFDGNFSRDLCDELYSEWIELSCGGYADMVFVADSDNSVLGFVSCHADMENLVGSIGLAGVFKEAYGRGIGTALVERAIEWFIERGLREVTVVTQGRNIAAQRLYQSCGFFISDIALWYHKWYSAPKRFLMDKKK